MNRRESLDSLGIDDLRRGGGIKWSLYPGKLGAFVAETDFGTAPAVIDALHDATDKQLFGYMPPQLSIDLSEATSGWFDRRYSWIVSPDYIHPIADVLKSLEIAVTHFSPPGSAIIVPTPTYMKFLTVASALGRDVIEIPLVHRHGRDEIDLDALDRAFAAGGATLTLCNPFNPLGRVFSQEELVDISRVVHRNRGRVFADEIHAPLVYAGSQHVPYASVSPEAASHTITGTSAAKAWNIPGLKCAQVIFSNDADLEVWQRVGKEAAHGASNLGVIANTVAYNEGGPWLDGVIDYLDNNRKVLSGKLAELIPEIGYREPEGTYVAWLDCRALDLGASPADFFSERAGVVLTDGASCGKAGSGFVRLIFATPRPILEEMIDRMAAALERR